MKTTYKQKKKLNRVMLNGEGNENGIKINRSNYQKKTNWMCSTLFFIISKKKPNLYVQHAFCLSLLLFCTTTTLLCRTKSSNFLVTHYFYGWIVVSAYPIFCLLCSCSLLFFTASHFHLAGPSLLAASISRCLTAALNFHVFLATKFVSFVFNHLL